MNQYTANHTNDHQMNLNCPMYLTQNVMHQQFLHQFTAPQIIPTMSYIPTGHDQMLNIQRLSLQNQMHYQDQRSYEMPEQPAAAPPLPPVTVQAPQIRKKNPLLKLEIEPPVQPAPVPPVEHEERPVVDHVKTSSKLFDVAEPTQKPVDVEDKKKRQDKEEELFLEQIFVPLREGPGRRAYTMLELNKIRDHPYTKAKRLDENSPLNNKTNSFHKKTRAIEIDLEVSKIQKVENAFVPTGLKVTKDDVPDEKKIVKELNGVLNRLMESNLKATVQEINALGPKQSLIAKSVFEMATKQPKFADVFSKLCLEYFQDKDFKEFKSAMLEEIKHKVSNTLAYHQEEANKSLDLEVEKLTDPTVKQIFEERRETFLNKAKDAYFGTMNLISELFLVDCFSDNQLFKILEGFVQNLDSNNAQSLVIIMNIAGKKLDEKDKPITDRIFKNLEAKLKTVKLETYLLYNIDSIVKKRANDWLKAGINKPVAPAGATLWSNSNPTDLEKTVLKPNQKKWVTGCNQQQQQQQQIQPQTVAWKTQQKVLTDQDFEARLRDIRGDPVGLFASRDDSYKDGLDKCYMPAFFYKVIETQVEKKADDRVHAGNMLESLRKDGLLTTKQMIEGCGRFAKNIENILEDVPKLFEYMGEIFSRFFVSPGCEDCSFVVDMCEEVAKQMSSSHATAGANILASCLKAALVEVADTQILVKKFKQNPSQIFTSKLNLSEKDLAEICNEKNIVFILSASKSESIVPNGKTAMHAPQQPVPTAGQNYRGQQGSEMDTFASHSKKLETPPSSQQSFNKQHSRASQQPFQTSKQPSVGQSTRKSVAVAPSSGQQKAPYNSNQRAGIIPTASLSSIAPTGGTNKSSRGNKKGNKATSDFTDPVDILNQDFDPGAYRTAFQNLDEASAKSLPILKRISNKILQSILPLDRKDMEEGLTLFRCFELQTPDAQQVIVDQMKIMKLPDDKFMAIQNSLISQDILPSNVFQK